MKNRKGFTLVELLAVIVILAVLVLLAVPSVLKMMDGAKENAFKIEAENLAKAAKMAYANDLLNDVETNLTTDGYCYSISFLKDNGYVDKNFSSSTVGSVLISNSDTEVWYYDGSKSVTKGIAGSISVDESLNTSTTDFDSCPVLTAYVSDGLKAWFDGSENTTSGHSGSATLWADLSGNNNTGNFHGAPTWGTNYLQLDGVDDDVYMGYLLYQNPTIEVVYSITGFRSTLYAAYNALAGGLFCIFNIKFYWW